MPEIILICNVAGGRKCVVNIRSLDATVTDLLIAASVATQYPRKTIRLFFQGKELKAPAATLRSFHIGDNGNYSVHLMTSVVELPSDPAVASITNPNRASSRVTNGRSTPVTLTTASPPSSTATMMTTPAPPSPKRSTSVSASSRSSSISSSAFVDLTDSQPPSPSSITDDEDGVAAAYAAPVRQPLLLRRDSSQHSNDASSSEARTVVDLSDTSSGVIPYRSSTSSNSNSASSADRDSSSNITIDARVTSIVASKSTTASVSATASAPVADADGHEPDGSEMGGSAVASNGHTSSSGSGSTTSSSGSNSSTVRESISISDTQAITNAAADNEGTRRTECPRIVATRLSRLDSQRLYVMDQSDNGSAGDLSRKYIVLGSTGSNFHVVVNRRPSCTCSEATATGAVLPCKHLIFLFVKVLKLDVRSPLVYQDSFSQADLQFMFDPSIVRHRSHSVSSLATAPSAATGAGVVSQNNGYSGSSSSSSSMSGEVGIPTSAVSLSRKRGRAESGLFGSRGEEDQEEEDGIEILAPRVSALESVASASSASLAVMAPAGAGSGGIMSQIHSWRQQYQPLPAPAPPSVSTTSTAAPGANSGSSSCGSNIHILLGSKSTAVAALQAEEDEEEECPICFDSIVCSSTGGAEITSSCSVCSRTLHKDCIDKWLRQSKTCPFCRSKWMVRKGKKASTTTGSNTTTSRGGVLGTSSAGMAWAGASAAVGAGGGRSRGAATSAASSSNMSRSHSHNSGSMSGNGGSSSYAGVRTRGSSVRQEVSQTLDASIGSIRSAFAALIAEHNSHGRGGRHR